jgi:hypothetical protein
VGVVYKSFRNGTAHTTKYCQHQARDEHLPSWRSVKNYRVMTVIQNKRPELRVFRKSQVTQGVVTY